MSNIQALSVDIKEVGKKIKSSKKRFTWFFSINGKKHTVDLFVSKLSGKKKLLLNGRSIHEEKNIMSAFCQRFEIDGNAINVQTKGDSFEMVFNKTQTFSELYTQAKTKSEFQEEEGHFDSYDNDFSKGKPIQSKYQGFSGSSYQPPSKNSQDLKGFNNGKNSNFNNNNGNLSDGSNSEDEPSSGGHKSDNLRINKNGSGKVDSKKSDAYGFDSGFDKYDWKANTNKQQVQKPKQSEQAFDNFNNQFSNPQRNQQQQAPPPAPVVQIKAKLPPTTDFSQFTFGGQPNRPPAQPQPQQTSQSSSSQAKSTFDAFGAPNASQAANNGGSKGADPFQDFFKQGGENIFANTGSQQNNKPANNPSNSFNNFGQQPFQENLPQQQKTPSQQQIIQQQPPVQQQAPPVKQQQQVNVFDLLGDDEPHVPLQPVQQQQIQPQAVQQPAFQAQPIQQQQSNLVNTNLVNLVNNLSINTSQNQPNLAAQPVQPQATNLLNMYEQSQQNQSIQQQQQQQQQKPQGSNYDALYAASNPFGGNQQQQLPQQPYGNYSAYQQGYGQQQQQQQLQQQQQQQQYNPFAAQFQPAPQQQGSTFQQIQVPQQQQPYQQQQFQPQLQAQQMGAYPPQNNYGYNNNIGGIQGSGAPIQFQQQTVQQVGSNKTPFDDLF